ncbi:MAG: filamentous hemagglutinin N-terminal domain-containing protein, partial [Magnetococcales bacterium]|nr:filamentous hemagglutinin N-terminal domain-containing protein [Magnetococcales bacterium]
MFTLPCRMKNPGQRPDRLSAGSKKSVLRNLVFLSGLGLGYGIMATCHALPTGGETVSGNVNIQQSPSTMNIDQASERALVDWKSFDIGTNEKVIVTQPSTGSILVNRVLGSDFSSISGLLSSNGHLVLINPHGILFHEGATVNVGGLTATTRWLSDDNFHSGNWSFNALSNEDTGKVVNRGVISISPGGSAVLAASHVENSGLIQARLGRVALAAGEAFTLNFAGDPLVRFAPDPSSKVGKAVKVLNNGTIQADGGSVLLTADAASSVVDSVVSMGGHIEARMVQFKEGKVIFHAGGGMADVNGTVDVSGENDGEKGGSIDVVGDKVRLRDSTHLMASGNTGGGQVRIGGDRGGNNPAIVNASQTIIDKGAKISADARQSGNGGRVTVWSEQRTAFRGDISARGGKTSGNGGSVETSSRKHLDFTGTVDTRAPKGTTGPLSLDPTDITVATAGANANTSEVDQFGDADVGGASIIAPATLSGANANIILQASNDIIFNDAVTLNSGYSLTAQAGRHITVNNGLTTTNAAIHLEADSPHSTSGAADGTGTLTIAATPGSLTTNGGSVTLIGADFSISGAISSGSGTISIGPSRSGTNGNLTIGSGALSLAELQKITSTGTVTVGKATTRGTDGSGTSSSSIQSHTITTDANLSLGSQTFGLKMDPSTGINLGSDFTLNNTHLELTAATTLTNGVTVTSGGGNITFGGTIDATTSEGQSLTLNAGTGDITLSGNVGTTVRTGYLTIGNARNVTAAGLTVGGITHTSGTGTTQISGAVDASNTVNITSNGGLTLGSTLKIGGNSALKTDGGNGNMVFNGTINGANDSTQNLTLTAGTGNLTINGAIGNTTRLGDVTIETAGTVQTSGIKAKSITQSHGSGTVTFNGVIDSSTTLSVTANGGITFGSALTMNNHFTLVTNETGSGGDIQFNSTIDGNKNLTLTAGSNGNITFAAAVGGNTRLGTLTINSAKNTSVNGTMTLDTLTQLAGSGTTTFSDTVTVHGTSGLSLTGTNFVINGNVDTRTAAANGPMTLTNSGVSSIAANKTIDLDGSFTQNGAGSLSIGGNITTTNDTISFAKAITLTANTLLSTGSGAGTITFGTTLDGTSGSETLGLTAGTGNILFTGAVGSTKSLGAITIVSAADVTTSSTL